MRHKKLRLSTILYFILGLTGLQAQEVIPATGGSASGSGGLVSYSVGQVVYTTSTGINGSVVQGVLQPFEISVVSGINEALDITLQCSAYPNPTTNFLTLKLENILTENITYLLYDISGKLLENKKVEGNESSIDMSNFLPATYFLRVIQSNKEVKIFKIIKN